MQLLLNGCKRHDRESQRLLYGHYYKYALSICVRYCKSMEEAKEVLNDGFLKVFQKIEQYKSETSFEGWLRRIMINASIDHYRKELKHYYQQSVDGMPVPDKGVSGYDELSYEGLMAMVQSLTPGYRAVFNLYAIDGYTHEEIGEILGITAGTSKSNLSKAREVLRDMIKKADQRTLVKYV